MVLHRLAKHRQLIGGHAVNELWTIDRPAGAIGRIVQRSAAQDRQRFRKCVAAVAAANQDLDEMRVGVTVSRQVKGSVDRNRARRRLREAARASLIEGGSGARRRGIRYDVVLIARPAALTVRFADLKEEAEQAALRLTERER